MRRIKLSVMVGSSSRSEASLSYPTPSGRCGFFPLLLSFRNGAAEDGVRAVVGVMPVAGDAFEPVVSFNFLIGGLF